MKYSEHYYFHVNRRLSITCDTNWLDNLRIKFKQNLSCSNRMLRYETCSIMTKLGTWIIYMYVHVNRFRLLHYTGDSLSLSDNWTTLNKHVTFSFYKPLNNVHKFNP
jgi:hypothetical protein